MKTLKIDIQNTQKFVSESDIDSLISKLKKAYDHVYNKTGKGKEFLGWVNLPLTIDEQIISSIENDVKKQQIYDDTKEEVGEIYLFISSTLNCNIDNLVAKFNTKKKDYLNKIFNDYKYFNIGVRSISISTAGIIEGI